MEEPQEESSPMLDPQEAPQNQSPESPSLTLDDQSLSPTSKVRKEAKFRAALFYVRKSFNGDLSQMTGRDILQLPRKYIKAYELSAECTVEDLKLVEKPGKFVVRFPNRQKLVINAMSTGEKMAWIKHLSGVIKSCSEYHNKQKKKGRITKIARGLGRPILSNDGVGCFVSGYFKGFLVVSKNIQLIFP